MDYVVYKMYFSTGVHFGKGTLVDAEPIVNADTLFSALCHESIRSGGSESLDRLVYLAMRGSLKFSDCLPFISDELYVPKPLNPVTNENNGNSSNKKAFKKLIYIPVNKLNEYLSGKLDPEIEVKKLRELGTYSVKSQAAIRGLDETMPFSVGVYSFNDENGLYVVIGYADSEDLYFVEELLQGLSYSGIGGKTSAGFGKFEIQMCNMPEELEKRINASTSKTIMTIASSMATEDEIEKAIENAHYLLLKRSGFVSSDTFAENPRKKKDFYVFKSGSCFKHSFEGNVFDVSVGGTHSVYRYAKPMLIGVD